jgi:hypothetical protein
VHVPHPSSKPLTEPEQEISVDGVEKVQEETPVAPLTNAGLDDATATELGVMLDEKGPV